MITPHTDSHVENAVIDALIHAAAGHSGELGVEVQHGVVTLTGRVNSYAAKWAAERAVHGVPGVRAVVNHVEMHKSAAAAATDDELAQLVMDALLLDPTVPDHGIAITIGDGVITLRGKVDWLFQRQSAEEVVRRLPGVRDVTNLLIARVRPHETWPPTLRERIERTLVRMAEAEMDHIIVEEHEGRVVLLGYVHSEAVRRAAESAVWLAKGVTAVENRLAVRSRDVA
jgi:osmotically-inducible protein OsmY